MKKRSAIIIAIILMSIGFAAVSTTLIINGNAKVSENEDDFSVIFTAASIDGKDVYTTVVDDTKKIINFSTSELKTLNQTSVLTYEVTNNSSQYDANVKVICVPKDGTTSKYTSIKNKFENDTTIVKAKEILNGTLTINLDKTSTEEVSEEYTCKLEFNAVERESIGYNGPTKWDYDYTGGEQTFVAPITGTYKLEVWGAQGGSYSNLYRGGYGGYSNGIISLKNSEIVYIYVGSEGILKNGGYNGGGSTFLTDNRYGGGGATHIAKSSGLLSTLEGKKNSLLIVAGGGGGADANDSRFWGSGGDAGGYIGQNGNGGSNGISIGGSQVNAGTGNCTSGSFGTGASNSSENACASGGGGAGYYGGGTSINAGGAGGSSYIGDSLLTEKSMYCYNCQESSEESTKTISTTCTSTTPTVNCAKQGNGYARITLIK